ncbi:PREDICTED: uncharacterized protein LOC108975562 [Bactrocera latifrons]|uniref:BED-type domain-containing protein n=1 Tax=Bactrocera latifrons TaxID=174628 RepID=A0A0K8UC08_BACLA|nr:PREDICTED: uncharacterized protein LOC108975562 [Bactrocera latifrons]
MEIDSAEETNIEQLTNISIHGEHIEPESTDDYVNIGNCKKRKSSFVWKYFRHLENSSNGSLECLICGSSVSKQTSNLARHLFAAHDINRSTDIGDTQESAPVSAVGRPSSSFIWKYCTKEDYRYARCHLCDKLLYFGGGNTANITKHLRRKHSDVITSRELCRAKTMDDAEEFVAVISSNQLDSTMNSCDDELIKVKDENNSEGRRMRKERKGSSYVWNYCEKLSRHTIRCKLCKKVMSFHGTANVITHLQRRHNIVGRVESETARLNNVGDEDNAIADLKNDQDAAAQRRRRSTAATSIVWKYCTRLGPDVVRCSFCKKNLSFQGTSNLQRHLHRMHGVVTQTRVFGELLQEAAEIDDTLIWEHCEHTEDGKIKCTMCKSVFDDKDCKDIRTHLTTTHAIASAPPVKRDRRRRRNLGLDDACEETDDYEYDNEEDNWRSENGEFTIEYNDGNMKKDHTTFDDIIEEDQAGQIICDEDPFDPNMMHNYPMARPLSAASSFDESPDRTFKMSTGTSRLRKLNEERLRMETEYFKEKAGYYRMQKYFTALQAKKARIELDRLLNINSNDTAYHVNIDMPNVQTSTSSI